MGTSFNGKPRSHCLSSECPYQTFNLNLAHPDRKREVKRHVVEMTFNGSGVRNIARVLHSQHSYCTQRVKKSPALTNRQSATEPANFQ